MFDTPFIIPVVAIIAWAVVAVVRAKHGIDESGNVDASSSAVNKRVESALAERDAEIERLRERVQVLEAIVTDTHKSHHLAEEIERLREG
ncbi:MAG: hypothetical protein AAF184_22285 [Pseudomonadota bacterium]